MPDQEGGCHSADFPHVLEAQDCNFNCAVALDIQVEEGRGVVAREAEVGAGTEAGAGGRAGTCTCCWAALDTLG